MGKAHGGVLLAVLIKQHNAVDALKTFEQQGGFAFLYFIGRGIALVFEGGDDLQLEVHIMFEPLDVDIDALLDIGDVGLGVGKLLTCGGAYIWWLIDIFMISDATKRKNLEILMMFG